MTETIKKNAGNTYLLVVDSTEELTTAIDYACFFAKAHKGHVALLNVMEMDHVGNWHNVEQRMRKELRAQAEQMVFDAARRVINLTGQTPMVCIEEGDRSSMIIKTIEANSNICALILAAAAHSTNPGPLVTYFSGKGLSKLSVPLVVVPGNIAPITVEEESKTA